MSDLFSYLQGLPADTKLRDLPATVLLDKFGEKSPEPRKKMWKSEPVDTRKISYTRATNTPIEREQAFEALSRTPKGLAEGALQFGSGMVAAPVAGLAGLGTLATTGDFGKATQTIANTADALTYAPRTKEGEAVGGLLNKPLELYGKAAEGMGEVGEEQYGIPRELTTGFLQAAPVALGGMKAIAPKSYSAGMGKLARGSVAPLTDITTYHGSPTSGIRKFDMNFRGTGEGRLAPDSPLRESFKDMIAHGLYTAENEGIAQGYQNRLGGGMTHYVGDSPIDIYSHPDGPLIEALADRSGAVRSELETNLAKAKQSYQKALDAREEKARILSQSLGGDITPTLDLLAPIKMYEDSVSRISANLDKVAELEKQGVSKKQDGSTYTAELLPHPDEYMLWDKPLSEQPEGVRNRINNADRSPLKKNELRREWPKSEESTDYTGREFYDWLQYHIGSDKAAAEYLNSLGIKGVKYLDSTSRKAGDGSYNYVTFKPEADTVITHENKQRIPGAVEEAYRKMRDPKSKALLEKQYPELKGEP